MLRVTFLVSLDTLHTLCFESFNVFPHNVPDAEVKWLLRIGADPCKPDYDHKQAIHWAVQSGQLTICKTLLSDGSINVNAVDRWGDTALVEAIARGYEEITEYLKKKGAKLPSDEEGIYSLCAASYDGNIEEIKQLLKRGVPVNSSDYDRRTALHIAASEVCICF